MCVLGHMANTYQLGGKMGSQPYAHLVGLLHQRSLGHHNLCIHTGTNQKQHSWVTQFCDPSTPSNTSSYKHKTNTLINIVSLHLQNLMHQVLWISQQIINYGAQEFDQCFPTTMRGDYFPNSRFVTIRNCS
jgi:hypothetical protein